MMTTRRFAWSSAAVLALLVASGPAFAQDGDKPRKPRVTRTAPRSPAPPPADVEVEEEEDEDAVSPEESESASASESGADSEAEAESETEAEAETASETGAEAEAELEPDAGDVEEEVEPATKKQRRRPRDRGWRRPPRVPRPPARRADKAEPPAELPYYEGMDIPTGYTRVESARTGLVIAGGVVFGVGWLAAATAAAASMGEDHPGCDVLHRDEDIHVYYEDVCIQDAEPEDFAPLYIPLAGPFIAMGTLEHAGGAVRAGLFLDGMMQVGGAAMFVAGLVAKREYLVRTGDVTVSVAPGPGTLQVVGSF